MRDSAWLYKHFRVLLSIYRAIRIFVEARAPDEELEFDFSDEPALLRRLAKQIEEIQSCGIPLQLQPWHLLVFVRESWYFRMHAK